MSWKNVWKNKPPVNEKVLLWIPDLSDKSGDIIIACPRNRYPGSKTIWWSFGNTVMWHPLPKPPIKRRGK